MRNVMGRSCGEREIKFKLKDFEEALQGTEFKGVSLEALLKAYFGDSMETHKEIRAAKSARKRQFFEDLQKKLDGSFGEWFSRAVSENKYGHYMVIAEYEKSAELTEQGILNAAKAVKRLEELSGKRVRLAVLSAEITSNPHYFDRSNPAGRFLIHALGYIYGVSETRSAEDILEVYYLAGIQPDDISSYTALFGISLHTVHGRHIAYETFIKEGEPYLVTLSNLNRIVKADCESKVVFVVENQMVFSQLCENFAMDGQKAEQGSGLYSAGEGSDTPDGSCDDGSGAPCCNRSAGTDAGVALLCTSGQMKTASLILIDLLCESGCTIFYSGDMDPEGLCVADKVIARHPEQIHPWRMTKEDYEASVSNEKLDIIRIRKMDKIADSRLRDTAAVLRQNKTAGDQELLLAKLENDIRTYPEWV